MEVRPTTLCSSTRVLALKCEKVVGLINEVIEIFLNQGTQTM